MLAFDLASCWDQVAGSGLAGEDGLFRDGL